MASNLINSLNKPGSTTKFIKTELHNEVLDRYANVKKATIDAKRAQLLQGYFRQISSYVAKAKLGTEPINISPFLQDLLNLGLPVMELFNYEDLDGSKSGIKFEEDLKTIIDTIFGKPVVMSLGGKKIVNNLSFLGEQLAHIPYYSLEQWSEKLNEWVPKVFSKGEQKQKDGIYRLGQVQGKIDLRIPNTKITINYEYSPSTLRFIKLLQDMNITAKNYTNMSSVSFGSAKYFRVVTSVMSDLGYESDIALKIYYSTRSARQNTELGYHKYHLRQAYEALGPGQYYDMNGHLQSFGTTDFLVVYDKKANTIWVRSTADIVLKALNKKAIKGNYINLTK